MKKTEKKPSEHDDKTKEKLEQNQQADRRFIKGGPGGPGRGHKKKQDEIDDEDLLDIIEGAARKGLSAKDWKDRLKAAGIGLKVLTFKKPENEPAPANPFTQKLLMFISNVLPRFALEANVSELEILERMLKGCPYCTKFGTGNPDMIGGVKLGLDETNNMNKVDRK